MIEQKIVEIVDFIVAHGMPKKVILFGSRARGGVDNDSDVDLAILYDGLDRNPFEIAAGLRMNLLAVTVLPIDLLVYDSKDFEARAKHGASFESRIEREGVRAYG